MQPLANDADVTNTVHQGLVVLDRDDSFQRIVPDYALLFFDHLYSEYLTLKSKIDDVDIKALLDSLQEKRRSGKLTWSDIYTFDLALIDERPLENLIRKAYDARARYRSIAGQKEFDEYLASKPPDLTTILIAPGSQPSTPAQPPGSTVTPPPAGGQPPPDVTLPDSTQMSKSAEIIQRVLRADIRYLLSKFYLYYAMLPMRENLREQLTTRAVTMTKWILALIVVLILVSFGGGLILKRFSQYGDLIGAFGVTVGSVAFAGIVGGCVSMLQRIQSAPSEGDALFNLAALTNGWRGLSLSPLYGGIFASLLFILFAAGLLQGSAFPKIETATSSAVVKPTEASQTAPAGNPVQTTTAAAPVVPSSGTTATTTTPISTPDPRTETQRIGILQVKDFLKETGPKDGVSFALLMIWSFIAGFAERLVPDTLNRLVAKNEAIQGTNS